MAQKLRLTSQKYSAKEVFASAIDVLVDTGITHLDKPFTYALSEKHGKVEVGSLVSVPFGSKILSGLVINSNAELKNNLKFIKKVIHRNPVITSNQIDLIQSAAERWTGNFWNFLKFALPNIPAKIEVPAIRERGIFRKVERPELRIGENYQDLIALIENRVNPGRQLLVVVPDQKELQFLRNNLKKSFIEYGSHLEAPARIDNYLKILTGSVNLIIGTRSSIFLPLKEDAEILIVDDLSFTFYESRFPYWNVRDLALIRSSQNAVTFYSHSPSLELVRLAEINWIRVRQKKAVRPALFFKDGKFSYQSIIKNGLREGAVLVLTPERGYINALVCSKCRNLYKCQECNGRLILESASEKTKCNLCGATSKKSNCNFCNSDSILSFRKGADRTLEELGKQFPNTPIRKGDSVSEQSAKGTIIISTYDSFPIQNYSAVISLKFENFSYRNNLRSSEIARKLLFDIRALGAKNNYFEIDSSDYFSQVMLIGDSLKSAERELVERKIAKLPPEYRIVTIDCDRKSAEIFQDQQFVDSVTYSGSVAVIKTPIINGAKLSSFIQEITNYRSLRRLKPWSVKVDPLDI
jgi:primosomal protein N' (replication factor Y)